MRKFISALLMLYAMYSASAQPLQLEDTLNVTRERWRDTCFGLIDKSAAQIPSGYLIDYSLSGINKDFDGVGNNDTLQAWGNFFYHYNILELSKVNSNGALQTTNDLFINAKRYLRDNGGTVPLLFLYQPYQKIKSTALSNNLFSVTSDSIRLMDVPGRGASPYDNKELFMFSSVTNYIIRFNTITFSLPSSFWQMPGISSVSINFDDGAGFRTISNGGTVSIYYATEGFKNITATITTSGGSRTAKYRIQYARPLYYMEPDMSWDINVSPVYTSENNYLGLENTPESICDAGNVFDRVNCDINPGAEVFVINGCDQVFDKPIIVVEGFDTDNGLDLVTLFNRFSLVYGFVDNLRSAGYDFVFVNFKKPTDFIENNAKVLEQVINQVNATKVGNIRGSVIGFSMGGLVSRWCLKDMEDRSIDHKMDHYFSYDTPHQGANIPLGMQYLFGELARDFSYLAWNNLGGSAIQPPFQQLVQSAQSPAAKQLLVTKGNYNNAIFNWDPTLNTLDPVRAAFAQRLVQKGYPQNLTRHGIAFGRGDNIVNTKQSGNGNQFGSFTPGSKIFDGNITFVLVNLTSSAFAVPENGNTDYICRYRFLGYKVVKLFGINLGTLPTLRVRNFRYTGQYPYDDAPGSYETTQTQFVDRFNPINGFATQASNQGHHGHSFVSTVSALDLQNQGYSSTNQWQSNNLFFNIDNIIVNAGQVAGNTLSNTTLSPFNDVLTYDSDCGAISGCQSINDDVDENGTIDVRNNNWNQFHNGFISRQASLFIQRKILNAVPGTTCPGICNNSNTISGPSTVCPTGIYQLLGGNISGLNIFWESENGTFNITNGQGTAQITITQITDGADFVRVTLTNSCGSSRVIRIPIVVGTPTPTGINGPNHNLCYSGRTSEIAWFYVVNPVSTLTYYWQIDGQGAGIGNSLRVDAFIWDVGNHQIRVRSYSAACGYSAWYTSSFIIEECSGNRLSVSPNPSNSTMNIEIVESVQNKGNKNRIQEIRIIDKIGQIKKKIKGNNSLKQTINIGELANDFYSVIVFNGEEWLAVKILKQ